MMSGLKIERIKKNFSENLFLSVRYFYLPKHKASPGVSFPLASGWLYF